MSFDPSALGWTIMRGSPFMELVGPIWSRQVGDDRRLGFLAEPRHANRHGSVHGGMLAAFLDTCMGYAVPDCITPTVTLDIHYLSPARVDEWIEGQISVRRRGRSLIFLDGMLQVDQRLIATGRSILKPPG